MGAEPAGCTARGPGCWTRLSLPPSPSSSHRACVAGFTNITFGTDGLLIDGNRSYVSFSRYSEAVFLPQDPGRGRTPVLWAMRWVFAASVHRRLSVSASLGPQGCWRAWFLLSGVETSPGHEVPEGPCPLSLNACCTSVCRLSPFSRCSDWGAHVPDPQCDLVHRILEGATEMPCPAHFRNAGVEAQRATVTCRGFPCGFEAGLTFWSWTPCQALLSFVTQNEVI